MIQSRLDLTGVKVVDLFAGSGALGLEALSRGASHVTFVEKSRKAVSILGQNVQALGVDDEVDIVVADAIKYLTSTETLFDLILADPPYAHPEVHQLPALLRQKLEPDGIGLLEHGPDWNADSAEGVILSREFGRTRITLFEAVSSQEKFSV